ncbi:unnamed protein product [Brassica oleracea]
MSQLYSSMKPTPVLKDELDIVVIPTILNLDFLEMNDITESWVPSLLAFPLKTLLVVALVTWSPRRSTSTPLMMIALLQRIHQEKRSMHLSSISRTSYLHQLHISLTHSMIHTVMEQTLFVDTLLACVKEP